MTAPSRHAPCASLPVGRGLILATSSISFFAATDAIIPQARGRSSGYIETERSATRFAHRCRPCARATKTGAANMFGRSRFQARNRSLALAGLAATLSVAVVHPARSQQAIEDFYRGRQLEMIIGYSPG